MFLKIKFKKNWDILKKNLIHVLVKINQEKVLKIKEQKL